MPDLKLIRPKPAPAIERLVDDYLAHCQAIGLSSKTVKFSYGYPLRQVFLPWCAEQGIAEVGALTSRDVDRLSIQLMEQGGKRGALSRGTVWTYLKAVKRFLAWGREEGEAVQAEAKLPKLPQRLVEVSEPGRDRAPRGRGAQRAGQADRPSPRRYRDPGQRVGPTSDQRFR